MLLLTSAGTHLNQNSSVRVRVCVCAFGLGGLMLCKYEDQVDLYLKKRNGEVEKVSQLGLFNREGVNTVFALPRGNPAKRFVSLFYTFDIRLWKNIEYSCEKSHLPYLAVGNISCHVFC